MQFENVAFVNCFGVCVAKIYAYPENEKQRKSRCLFKHVYNFHHLVTDYSRLGIAPLYLHAGFFFSPGDSDTHFSTFLSM